MKVTLFIIIALCLKTTVLFAQVLEYPAYEIKNYFGHSKDNPTLSEPVTREEEKKLVEFIEKTHWVSIDDFIADRDTLFSSLYAFLPHIRGRTDTSLFYYLLHKDSSYKGVPYSEIRSVLYSDAVIKGKIVARRSISKAYPDKCFKYKTEFIIEVQEVVYSFYDVQVGDYVSVLDVAGIEGGCSSVGIRGSMNFSHHKFYDVYDVDYFEIGHNKEYRHFFYRQKEDYLKKFEDFYCFNCFSLALLNSSVVSRSKKYYPLIKEFIDTYNYEK